MMVALKTLAEKHLRLCSQCSKWAVAIQNNTHVQSYYALQCTLLNYTCAAAAVIICYEHSTSTRSYE